MKILLIGLGRMQHAYLYGIHTQIFDHCVNLIAQHLRRNAMNGPHTQGVLRGQGSNRRHAVAAKRRKGFQIRLNARPAATV